MSINDIEKDYSMVQKILSTIGPQKTLQKSESMDSQEDGQDKKLLELEKKMKDYKNEIGERMFDH